MSFDDPQTFVMIGAAFDVHNELGPGFWSRYTPPPLRSSSGRRGIDYRKEVPLPISYKGELLPMNYRVDSICFGDVIAEIKALKALGGVEEAQEINYLRASGLQRALLINFGACSLQYRRVVVDLPGSGSASKEIGYSR